VGFVGLGVKIQGLESWLSGLGGQELGSWASGVGFRGRGPRFRV
jgi:hypothetical protein